MKNQSWYPSQFSSANRAHETLILIRSSHEYYYLGNLIISSLHSLLQSLQKSGRILVEHLLQLGQQGP